MRGLTGILDGIHIAKLLYDPKSGTLLQSHDPRRFATINVPEMGTIMLAKNVGLCDQGMRLIGRPLLLRLAEVADEKLQDDLRALAAEFEAASWKSSKSLKRAFPEARIEGRRVIVDLDERHCAAIIIDYERSVSVVEYAGASANYRLVAATAAKSGRRK